MGLFHRNTPVNVTEAFKRLKIAHLDIDFEASEHRWAFKADILLDDVKQCTVSQNGTNPKPQGMVLADAEPNGVHRVEEHFTHLHKLLDEQEKKPFHGSKLSPILGPAQRQRRHRAVDSE